MLIVLMDHLKALWLSFDELSSTTVFICPIKCISKYLSAYFYSLLTMSARIIWQINTPRSSLSFIFSDSKKPGP